jgi:predicted ATPase
MRLRYLHLPRCGPLTDTAIVFGREDLIAETLNMSRKGFLNFIVGVNGSGKSSLLRAIYGIFRALNRRETPGLPFTLAWDRTIGNTTVTALLHFTNHKTDRSFFAAFEPIPVSAKHHDWESIITSLTNGEAHPLVKELEIVDGPDALTSPMLYARLPKRLIAYTSGDVTLWGKLDHPVFRPADEEEGTYQTRDERPHDWNMDKEWRGRQLDRVFKTMQSFESKTHKPRRIKPLDHLSYESTLRVTEEMVKLEDIHRKVISNHMLHAEPLDESYFQILPRHLRFAGMILGLWQAARELPGHHQEVMRESLRDTFLKQCGADEKPKDARRVLNEIDWFWPTHMSLVYRDDDDRANPRQRRELLCLLALADEVVAQPSERHRVVISLGPCAPASLTEKLGDAFPLGIPDKTMEDMAGRVDGCKTGAEAILRIFSEDDEIESTPMDVFSRLRDWERSGMLDDITLTIKRLHRPEAFNGEADDIIITYDQLSDGEQMLLGRMGLLFLLRGQDGSLLLLDEPETHFNDVWKREIVEMMDMSLLNATEAQILVSTHTSIALTDAFAAEVIVLDRTDNGITARGVTGGLFGTDPGEVAMNLFRADSSTGSRSVELLDQLLKTDWKGRENELEAILNVLGSSFHRAELRAILKKLRASDHAPSSR